MGVQVKLGVRMVKQKSGKLVTRKKKERIVFRFDETIYVRMQKRIRMCEQLMQMEIKKQKKFFVWIFHIIKVPRFLLGQLQRQVKKKQIVRYERRTAPVFNLRLYALYVAVLRDGKASKAQNIISKVIILLTENSQEHSGCLVLNRVLRYLEPGVGLLIYRRGRNLYRMPIPLWPSRKRFLAVKFLMKGARRRQKLENFSIILALFYEILDVYQKKRDCFTLKIVKKYRQRILKAEAQSWRVKKRKF